MLEQELAEFFAEHDWRPYTESLYGRILRRFFSQVSDVENLSAAGFRKWLMDQTTWGESMKWTAYIAVRSFLRWKYGEDHPALRFRFRRREEGKPQRTLSPEQVSQLLASIPYHTVKGKRDRALILFMLDTGVRASEVCRLDLNYLSLEDREFSVVVKGGRWHQGVFSKRTARALEEWLQVRPARPGVTAVFVSVGGLKPGTPLTANGLKVLIRKLGEQAGIGRISPHDFRRTFTVLALKAGAPTRLVQIAGGWKRIDMVERYSRTLTPEDFDPYFPSEHFGRGGPPKNKS